MKQTIYLVGQISPKFKETYDWRTKVKEYCYDLPGINFIDPCDNPFNQKLIKQSRYAITESKRSFGMDVLTSKDFTFCKNSTMAIANMNQYDPDKPLIGSFFELAWYFTMPEKTVIGITNDPNSYTCKHPFVNQAITTWACNEEEASYLVKKYFTGS